MGRLVPAFRPALPPVDRLLPYLRRIDAARIYTNWGPLATEFEHRLATHFDLPEDAVVSASSGTAAIVGAVLAAAGRATPARPLAIVPAMTFVATAIAVEQCGYRPYLVDVDATSWLLDPERVGQHALLDQVGLVVPVAAFGKPVFVEACHNFQQRTGIPVVVDGGASFEAVSDAPNRYLGAIPVALSFHATKSFSTGEGGCIITTDNRLAANASRALNFGFHGSRNSTAPSTNGKMSEYHAAVGLAELDDWPQKCRMLADVAKRYRRKFEAVHLSDQFIGAPTVAGCYALFRAANALESDRLQEGLSVSDVEHRLWYGHGLGQQQYFQEAPRDQLGTTESIARLLIGLPMATDLSDDDVGRVVDSLADTTRNRTS
jgi:dTDP-4-amino-4,6-dideoxygalactose transaminase